MKNIFYILFMLFMSATTAQAAWVNVSSTATETALSDINTQKFTFSVDSTITLDGGFFEMKRGSLTFENITFSIYDDVAKNNLLASSVRSSVGFDTTLATEFFPFSSATSLTPGNTYYAEITTSADNTVAAEVYTITGVETLSCNIVTAAGSAIVGTSCSTTQGAIPNNPPTADAGVEQYVSSGSTVDLNGSGTDPDGHALTYSWTQTGGPAITLSNAAVANPSFTAPTLNIGDPQALITFDLTVDDGFGGSDTSFTNVFVNPPSNTVPVADAGTPQSVNSGQAGVQLDGTGSSDADGHPLTYSWTQVGGTAVTLSDATNSSPTFTAPTLAINAPNQILTFQLIVNGK